METMEHIDDANDDHETNDTNDYVKYRGKCREMSEEAIRRDPSLTLVRGYYICPFWGKQEHWWTIGEDGTIVDPTKDQFPSKGLGEYVPFNGFVECAECGKELTEETVEHAASRFAFCSSRCYGLFVGVYT